MSESIRQNRRRHGTVRRLADHRLSVAVGADLGRRIEAGAERYGVSQGLLMRAALEAGLPAALKRMKRETSGDATEADAKENKHQPEPEPGREADA